MCDVFMYVTHGHDGVHTVVNCVSRERGNSRLHMFVVLCYYNKGSPIVGVKHHIDTIAHHIIRIFFRLFACIWHVAMQYVHYTHHLYIDWSYMAQ